MPNIVVADLSNIEGRGLAYLAGEEWKLEAFRAFDAGEGPDLYNITATSIIGGDPYAVSKKDRNVFGKVPDLALGYEGGVGALQTFAKAYGVSMTEQWGAIQKNIDKAHVAGAKGNWEKWGEAKNAQNEEPIDKIEWLASETVKLAWRARHPKTKQLWYDLKDAAVNAIQRPGKVFEAGPYLKLSVRKTGGHAYLLIKLPSGRFLTYFHPKLYEEDRGWKISYMGMMQRTPTAPKIWGKVFTYGGKLAENATQAFARDVLMHNMPAIEAAGFEIILTVHDENITESDKPHEELAKIMARVPPYAKGLPLAAAGFTATRYKKD